MSVFTAMEEKDHEQVAFFRDSDTGLKAIVAIHDTTIGPALGGCRMWDYATDEEALKDVLRLSRGMSYKAAIANLNLGGGKSVIIGNSKTDKSEMLFRSFGRFIEGLGGRYITAEDVGTSVKDMEWVRMETDYVTGISRALGGSGDPSPVTARGVYVGMKATVKKQLGKESLAGLKVGVQGLGHVGYYLCKYLNEAGAKLIVADLYEPSVKRVVDEFNAEVVGVDDIYDADMDVYAPCAMGATLNSDTIPRIKASVIAGAANNQLEKESRDSKLLLSKKIMYFPDYVINAGGLINVANELQGYNKEKAHYQVEGIYYILMRIFDYAATNNISTLEAANLLAERRVNEFIKWHH